MVTKSLPLAEKVEPPTGSLIFPHESVSLPDSPFAGLSSAVAFLAVASTRHGVMRKQQRDRRWLLGMGLLMICLGNAKGIGWLSLFGDRFIQIQQDVADGGPGRQLAHVHA